MTVKIWSVAVDEVRPFIARILTPTGSGTGFLVSYSADKRLCGIATALHVVSHAHFWHEPIRITHYESQKQVMLKEPDRSVLSRPELDAATIVFAADQLPLPEEVPQLAPEGRSLKTGFEVGWLGFPALAPENLCFFTGNVSSWIEDRTAYLVDGVAINGVSGGPCIVIEPNSNEVVVIGIVAAYIPNRATGESLPGLSLVSGVTHFHDVVKTLKSIDEAKEEETSEEYSIEAPSDDVHTA